MRNQRQRFRCKTCRKTLNSFSKTPMARLRHPEVWPQYFEGMTHSLTLRPAARQCGVSLKTSFRWRHRFLQAIILQRPSRKRGDDKKTKCRQIPVLVARGRDNQTVDGILENESAHELCRHLNGRINIEAVVCADASLAHEKLARALGFTFKGFTFKELVLASGVRVIEGVFHLQHVNAYHSHLKQWITEIFHGVATKYLSHYLGWRRALTDISALTADRLGNKILEFIHYQPLKAT